MTTNRFDTKAADWDKKKKRVQVAAAIAEAMAGFPLTTEMKAMEYGCGTGLVGLTLAPQLQSLLAVDSSSGMINVLTDKISEEQISNITPLQCDLQTDTFDETFDLIFTSMTLHHVEQLDSLLEEFFKLLNPGGLLLIADLVDEDGSFHSGNDHGAKHHGFDPNDLGRKLSKIGFTAVGHRTVHTIEKPGKDGVLQSFPVFLMNCDKQ